MGLSFGSLFPSLSKEADARASPKTKLLSHVSRAGVRYPRGGTGMPIWGQCLGYKGSSTVISSAEGARAFQHACSKVLAVPETSPKFPVSNTYCH